MLKKFQIFHPATSLERLEEMMWFLGKLPLQPATCWLSAVIHSVFTRSSNMLSPGLLPDFPQLDIDLHTSPVGFLLPSLLIWLDGKLHSEGVRSSPMRTLFFRLRTLDLCCRSISTQELIQQKTQTKKLTNFRSALDEIPSCQSPLAQ